MTAESAYAPVAIGRDEYRIPGLSVERLRRALSLLTAADALQGSLADGRREQLLQAMIVADFDPMPVATMRQAERLARRRQQLLASGAYSIEALATLRGDAAESATRTWLTRRRKAAELFTVTHQNATLLPAFQLDETGEPLTGLPSVLRPLQAAGFGGWAIWGWLTSASPWLDGAVPVELLGKASERVAAAARRFASNAA
jgi:hypothetical protein